MPSPVVQWGDPRQYLNRRDRGKRETALGLGKWWRWGMGRVTSGLRRPLPTRKTDWRAAGSLALPGFEGRVSDGHSRSELRTQNHSMAPTRDMEAGLCVQWLRRDRVGDREAACQAHGALSCQDGAGSFPRIFFHAQPPSALPSHVQVQTGTQHTQRRHAHKWTAHVHAGFSCVYTYTRVATRSTHVLRRPCVHAHSPYHPLLGQKIAEHQSL